MKRPVAYYPVLLAIYYILSSRHLRHNPFTLLYIRYLAILLVLVLLAHILFTWVHKDHRKAAVLVLIPLVFVFSYDGALLGLEEFLKLPLLSVHRVLLPLVASLSIIGFIAIWRSKRTFIDFTRIVNIAALFLIVSTVILIAFQAADRFENEREILDIHSDTAILEIKPTPKDTPDIYVLMLDAYARDDVLAKLFDYDNTWFLEALRKRGFYIASESRSNYMYTQLSFASLLNFEYLEAYDDLIGSASEGFAMSRTLFDRNRTFQFLQGHGYQTYWIYPFGFHLGHKPSSKQSKHHILHRPLTLNLAEHEFLSLYSICRLALPFRVSEWRKTSRFIFDAFSQSVRQKGPHFVMAYAPQPHPPFVFDRQGGVPEMLEGCASHADGALYYRLSGETVAQYRQRYRDQLHYLNLQILRSIDTLLESSPKPPIIVLLSDHGSRSAVDFKNLDASNLREGLANFMAFHLPGQASENLYPTLTPINVFPFIFNHYFNESFDLAPDRVYVKPADSDHPFRDVTDQTAGRIK